MEIVKVGKANEVEGTLWANYVDKKCLIVLNKSKQVHYS